MSFGCIDGCLQTVAAGAAGDGRDICIIQAAEKQPVLAGSWGASAGTAAVGLLPGALGGGCGAQLPAPPAGRGCLLICSDGCL